MDKKSLLSVHLAVLLFGTSGVFIKIIPMSALLLTLGRGIFSALALYAFIHFREYSLRLERLRDYFWNLLAGIFLAMHWFLFIMSIQISTVSIGTITFATYPLFVVFLEPYVFKEKFQLKNLLNVVMIAIGIAFLIPAFELNNATTLGILYGLGSSFCFAILSIINRRLAALYDSVVITLYEQTVAACLMTILISIIKPTVHEGTVLDFFHLIIYGVVFTGLAHSLYIQGLKGIKAQTASIISVLEPVYSIVLAIVFLQERMSYQEMIGTFIIFVTVMIATLQNSVDEKT
ncbi:MAG: DMT family transporter [Longibaculum muris]|uniref:Threonine/homoserine efflux transporter RhtA n=1 Tax=Longibaculum muris TaxID=1796628 RepID=A0A4R3YPL6_9FIRM|nr:DMT family transporter [Longibaculum muris]KXU51934.1 putative membrane protein [Candidatus Stoquefichus sp. KLE1796]MCR1889090.1 DMT family transporter [Longibaculum muris]MED9811516.1 DMT family transporter [Longibaculum muris]TCV93104.1 threonine/homoserine efflux transporter RhtA [Longibaculum muris]